MFAVMDDLSTDAVRVSTDPTGSEIRIRWGATTVKLSIAEAVDLVDAVASVLSEIASGDTDVSPAISTRPIRRDEFSVRAAAEIREAL